MHIIQSSEYFYTISQHILISTFAANPSHVKVLQPINFLLIRSKKLAKFIVFAVSYGRICPSPKITYFVVVSASNPIGPLACNFWVLIPISAPNPNSNPSVNLVDALT